MHDQVSTAIDGRRIAGRSRHVEPVLPDLQGDLAPKLEVQEMELDVVHTDLDARPPEPLDHPAASQELTRGGDERGLPVIRGDCRCDVTGSKRGRERRSGALEIGRAVEQGLGAGFHAATVA